MVTKILPVALAAMTLALAGCTQDELNDNLLANGPVAAQVTAGIGNASTRATTTDSGSSFESGDVIYVVAANDTRYYTYTLQNSVWGAGSDPFYFQNGDDVEFKAWHIAAGFTENGNTVTIDTQTQTTDDGGWNKNDVLVTPTVKAGVRNTDAAINFTGDNAFAHIMSQLVFTFKAGDGISDLSLLEGYTVKSITTDATFNTLTCALTAGSTTGDIVVSGISAGTATSYEAAPIILVPQAFANNQFELEVSYNGQTYKANLTTPGEGFVAGTSYAYTVTISNTALRVGNATITDWISSDWTTITGDATLM